MGFNYEVVHSEGLLKPITWNKTKVQKIEDYFWVSI